MRIILNDTLSRSKSDFFQFKYFEFFFKLQKFDFLMNFCFKKNLN